MRADTPNPARPARCVAIEDAFPVASRSAASHTHDPRGRLWRSPPRHRIRPGRSTARDCIRSKALVRRGHKQRLLSRQHDTAPRPARRPSAIVQSTDWRRLLVDGSDGGARSLAAVTSEARACSRGSSSYPASRRSFLRVSPAPLWALALACLSRSPCAKGRRSEVGPEAPRSLRYH